MRFSVIFYVFVTVVFVSSLAKSSAEEEVEKLENPVNQNGNFREFFTRSRDHIRSVLNVENVMDCENENLISETLKKLTRIYNSIVKPLEEAYRYRDMNRHILGDGEIYAVPKVVFVGPWSTGKSSLINYLLEIENTNLSLPSGSQPTTSDFTVLTYGPEHKVVDGTLLVMDSGYSSLEKYGSSCLEKLESIQIPSNLLKMVNFIDTPGIIENRKQQERGYPFSDVCRWFIARSDLIVLVFDPTKLDVGIELEMLFTLLKDHEPKVRIILNKADTLSSQELMRVYGSLFWSLSPLINITEPPRVYVGSFWSKAFQTASSEFQELFIQEEFSLLNDIYEVMSNRIEHKIALLRQQAVHVRNHALLVDQYVHALHKHRSIFQDIHELARNIAYTPDEYKVFQKVLAHPDVSKEDLPSREEYRDFFAIHSMDSFLPLSKYCGFVSSCLLDSINYAIHEELPKTLEKLKLECKKGCSGGRTCGAANDHEKQKYMKKN